MSLSSLGTPPCPTRPTTPLQGWDVDEDGKVELQEVMYVLDEFCGEICFECRCPTVHSKEMSVLAGARRTRTGGWLAGGETRGRVRALCAPTMAATPRVAAVATCGPHAQPQTPLCSLRR